MIRLVIFCLFKKKVRIWDVATQNPLKTFEGHLEKVNSVQFNNDNTQILSCSDDKTGIFLVYLLHKFVSGMFKKEVSLSWGVTNYL
jgi:WD40 repeat protein